MLIPEHIDKFDSTGERILYLKFQNDGSTRDMYVLHSLFTNHHLKNISGELDFLVIAPNEGVFAIEVKHGRVSREDGTWIFENGKGEKTRKTKSPFAQVDGTMNSIRKHVLDKVKHKPELYSRMSKILWGTGIAFTSMESLVDFGTEAHSWQILTRQSRNLPISTFISTLSRGWHNENNRKFWYDSNLSRPSKKDCKTLLQILRGDFDITYSDVNRLNDNEILIEEFTKEQFDCLDLVNYNDRVIFEGAAGTGKTVMAVELTKRFLNSGEKVGLFCYNSLLGEKLASVVSQIPVNSNSTYFTGTLHSYLHKYTNIKAPSKQNDVHQFFSEDLPFEFLAKNDSLAEEDKFDVLILDETQDLISPYYLEVFDCILKGGIRNGRWVMFGDFSNQAIFIHRPEEIFEILRNRSNFARSAPLKINCRNTVKIATYNTYLTGVEIPTFKLSCLEGKKVNFVFVDKEEVISKVDQILHNLTQNTIPVDKISLLSPKKWDRKILAQSDIITAFRNKGGHVETIQAYKGLENTVVILYGFDDLESVIVQRLLYVGISRARQELYAVFDNDHLAQHSKLLELNGKKLL